MAINVPIISQFDNKGVTKAIDEFKKLETPAQKAGFAIKKAFVPAAAALGGLVVAAVKFGKAAAEDQASASKLAGQIERVTGATKDQIKQNEKFIGQLELQTNILDTDLRPAFGKLVTATKDVTKAQDLLQLATDISVATGKDLSSVTDALGKAYGGNMTALQKLDPSLRDVIKSGADFDEVGKALADTFGGAAAEATETAEGKFKNLQIQMGNAQEAIGYLILPIVERLIPALQFVVDLITENTTAFTIIGGVIGVVAGAIVGLNIAMKAYLAIKRTLIIVQGVFNAILAANPVVLITIAVVALIAILVALQIRFNIIGKVVEFVGMIFGHVKDFVIDAWNKVLDWFKALPGLIKTAFSVLFEIMIFPYKLAYDLVIALWTRLWGWFKKLPGRLANAVASIFEILIAPFRNVVSGMFNIGRDIVSGIVDGIKSAASAIGSAIMGAIPGGGLIGGAVGKIKGILPFADGGLVTGPTIGLIGEAGPEVVIPLDKLDRMGGGNVTINIAGSVIQETDLVERIRIGLVQAQRNGRQVA
jgi:phage-related protein